MLMFHHIINDKLISVLNQDEFITVANEFYSRRGRPEIGAQTAEDLAYNPGAFFLTDTVTNIEYYVHASQSKHREAAATPQGNHNV